MMNASTTPRHAALARSLFAAGCAATFLFGSLPVSAQKGRAPITRQATPASEDVTMADQPVVYKPVPADAKPQPPTRNTAGGTVIYDNGGLATGTLSNSGVTAPAGTQWSEAQNDTGNLAESNTNAGYTVTGQFRLADDFTVPTGQSFTITCVDVFGYQTNSPATPSPFAAHTLQIWNGPPGEPGSTVIFGDTTTNRQLASVDAGLFRLFNSAVPPPGQPTGTTRRIWRNSIDVNSAGGGLTLPAGTYWVDWAATMTNAGTAFAPPTAVVGSRTQPGWNARQSAAGTWTQLVDTGNPPEAPDVPQDFPFKLIGPAVASTPVNVNSQVTFTTTTQGLTGITGACATAGYTNQYNINVDLRNIGTNTFTNPFFELVELQQTDGPTPPNPFRLRTADDFNAAACSGGLTGATQAIPGPIVPAQIVPVNFQIAMPQLRRFRFLVSVFATVSGSQTRNGQTVKLGQIAVEATGFDNAGNPILSATFIPEKGQPSFAVASVKATPTR